MKKILLFAAAAFSCTLSQAQTTPTDAYDLIKRFLYDSTGYENVGDWAVGKPKKFPVHWKEDRLIMSNDTSINFYRMGTADISVNGRRFLQAGQPVKWNVMLKGPRMGYTSFSILGSPSKDMHPKYTLDSLFGKKPYTATLVKSCDNNNLAGFYYYQVKMPRKDPAFVKLSWLSLNGNTAMRIDVYDTFSQYAAKLNCP